MRHFIIVPVNDDSGPLWTGGTAIEQGYNVLPLPSLKRIDAKNNEYHVYSNETEFKKIEADSVVNAVIASQINDPVKVIHAHTRVADVMDTTKLEYQGNDSLYMAKHGFAGKEDAPELTCTIQNDTQTETPAPAAAIENSPSQENPTSPNIDATN